MSSPTTVEVPAQRWTLRQVASLIAVVAALVAGVVGVYALTATAPARPPAVPAEEVPASNGCSAGYATKGGLIAGLGPTTTCGDPAGTSIPRGLQP